MARGSPEWFPGEMLLERIWHEENGRLVASVTAPTRDDEAVLSDTWRPTTPTTAKSRYGQNIPSGFIAVAVATTNAAWAYYRPSTGIAPNSSPTVTSVPEPGRRGLQRLDW